MFFLDIGRLLPFILRNILFLVDPYIARCEAASVLLIGEVMWIFDSTLPSTRVMPPSTVSISGKRNEFPFSYLKLEFSVFNMIKMCSKESKNGNIVKQIGLNVNKLHQKKNLI
ncbi:MAG: hypothetical protein R2766_01410 [Saprospiraceae bacterium]